MVPGTVITGRERERLLLVVKLGKPTRLGEMVSVLSLVHIWANSSGIGFFTLHVSLVFLRLQNQAQRLVRSNLYKPLRFGRVWERSSNSASSIMIIKDKANENYRSAVTNVKSY